MATENAAGLRPLPSPSAPPRIISERTSNEDVQLYVLKLLRDNEQSLTQHGAWGKAQKVIRNGRAVLKFKEEGWVEQLGIHGRIVSREIESQKYVNVSNKFKSYYMILMSYIIGRYYMAMAPTHSDISSWRGCDPHRIRCLQQE